MDRKTLISIVVTFILTAILATVLSTYQRGSDALTEDKITGILKKTQVTIIGGEEKTYGEAFSIINEEQIKQREALEALTAD